MGRVRSYKKIKACDPFSKRNKREVDTVHDEPPEIHEDKALRQEKRKIRSWETADDGERELQREARRVLRETERSKHATSQKVEGKREDESMRDFKTRIRQETRLALVDALKSKSATSAKRKERLKDRKLKRQGKPAREAREDLEEGFSSSADGRLRASDLGGSDEFAGAEVRRFGDRSERPPDLKGLLKFTEKPMMQKQQQQQQQQQRAPAATARRRDAGGGGSTSSAPPLAKKKTHISDVLGMDGDAGEGLMSASSFGSRGGLIHAGDGSGKSSATASEMEMLRTRVQEAYKKVQEKRKAAR